MATMTAPHATPNLVFVDACSEVTGECIKQRRMAMGMSASALATSAGVHRNTVASVEKGTVVGTSLTLLDATLRRLEEASGMDTPDLITSTIELTDGTRVVFAGSADGVAEAAARYIKNRDL